LLPLEFLPTPMRIFAVRIEHALNVTVQRPHDTNPRHHRRAAMLDHQHQRLNAGLAFREGRFPFRQAGDVVTCIPQRDQRLPVA
jgi:hypothetical protein